MKRKLIALLLVASCVVSLLGCSSNKKEETITPDKEETTEDLSGSDAEPAGITVDDLEAQRSEKELTQEADREKFWNSFEEDIPMKEVDFGSYDIYETTATRMVERIKNKDTFVLFITTAQNKAKDIEKEIFVRVAHDIVPDFPVYYVEEDYGYDTYAEEMNTIEPLIPYLTKENTDEHEPSLSPYHYGIYEFVNGELVYINGNIQVFDPENMDADSLDTLKKNIETEMRLIIGNLPSKYNFETVMYKKDELELYLKNNPNCVLYVGRDSCPYCPFTRRGVSTLMDRCKWTVPVAYFCAQEYAMSDFIYGSESIESANIKEEWKIIKSNLNTDIVPSVIVYKNGEIINVYHNGPTKDLYEGLVKDGAIDSFLPGQEIDWDLNYSEGNPKNDTGESSEVENTEE